METKSEKSHTIVLSSYETEVLTRALVEAAKEKPAPKKVQFPELKKKKKAAGASDSDPPLVY
jgi:hypothetical protein